MKTLLLTEAAESDLRQIWEFIALDSVHQADRWIDRLHARCIVLADQPGFGRPRPELADGLRCYPHRE